MENVGAGAKINPTAKVNKGTYFLSKLRKGAKNTASALFVTLCIAEGIVAYTPLPAQQTSKPNSVYYDESKFFLSDYISFEAEGSKFSKADAIGAGARSRQYTQNILDSLKTKNGFSAMPQNDGEVVALGNAIRRYLDNFGSYDAQFVYEAFLSSPENSVADCDTKAAIAGQLFKFYGIEPILLSVPFYYEGLHAILGAKTPWGSTLYFDMNEEHSEHNLKWVKKTFGCVLASCPIVPGNVVAMYAKEFTNGTPSFESMIKKDSTFSIAYWRIALSYMRIKKYEKALESVEKAIKFAPEYSEYYYTRAQVNHKLGNPSRELADLNKAIELDSSYADARMGRARLLSLAGQYERAAKDYEALLDMDGVGFYTMGNYYELYRCYKNMGEEQKASEYLAKANLTPERFAKREEESAMLEKGAGSLAKKISNALKEMP